MNTSIRTILVCTMIGLAALVLASLSWERNRVWESNLTLFSNDIPHLENCARAHYHFANALALEHQQNPQQYAHRFEEIVHHMERAISIADYAYNARLELGLILVNNQQADRASPILEEFVARFPDQGRPYFYLGYCRYFQGRYEEAIDLFQQSIQMAPNREDVYVHLAWSYYHTGAIPQGIEVLEKRLKLARDAASLWEVLSDLYFVGGDPERGHQILDEMIQRQPENMALYLKRIQRYEEGGDMEKAAFYRQELNNLGLQAIQ